MNAALAEQPVVEREHRTDFFKACRLPVVVGLALRLALAPFTSVSTDVGVWATAVRDGIEKVPLYSRPGFSYPPVWGYMLHAGGFIAHLVGLSPQAVATSPAAWSVLALRDGQLSPLITTPLATFAIKLPLICSDVVVAWLLWQLVLWLGMDARKARVAVALWFVNPLVIFATAVHGAFDTLVALVLVAALLARLRQRFFLCGLLLAVGVLTKITPAFVVPLLLASCVWTMEREEGFDRTRALVRMAAGGLAATVAIIAPLLIAGTAHGAFSDVFTRASTPGSVGGLSWLGFSSLPSLSSVSTWALEPGNPLSKVSVLVDLAVAAGVAVIWARRRRRDGLGLLALAAVVILVVIVIGPLANPQYLLWLLPLLCPIAAMDRRLAVAAGAMSLAGLVFEVAVQAPLGFVSPLSLAFGVPSFSAIVTDRLEMLSVNLLGVPVGRLFELASWALMMVAAAVTARASISWARSSSTRTATLHSTVARRANVRLTRRLRVLSASMLAGPVLLGVLPSFGGRAAPLQLTMDARAISKRAVAISWIFGNAPSSGLPTTVMATSAPQALKRVIIYSDMAYPVSGSSAYAVQGVVDHLPVDLTGDGVNTRTEVVKASGLRRVLHDVVGAPGTVVVDVSGTLPNTVWSASTDEVTPFLKAGGTLVWAGDEPGYYSVGQAPSLDAYPPPQGTPDYRCGPVPLEPGPPLSTEVTALGAHGVDRLLGVDDLLSTSWGWNCVAEHPSPVASALGLSSAAVHAGPSLHKLKSIGGTDLGYDVLGRSSIAWIPRGKGGLLLFSGTVNATYLSSDVATLLASSGAQPHPRFAARFGPATSGSLRVSVPTGTCRVELALVASHPGSPAFVARHTTVDACSSGPGAR